MRRRFSALGYVFFVLLTVTGVIMAISFVERISTKPIVTRSDLIDEAWSDTASIQADPAFVVENLGNDLRATLKNFHYYPDAAFIEPAYRSNCLSCHMPLPHNRDIKLRAFLNMHGNFIACQTCHATAKPDKMEWLAVEQGQVASVLPPDIPLMSVQLVSVEQGKLGYTRSSDPAFQQLLAETGDDSLRQDQLCLDNYRGLLDQAWTCKDCHTDQAAILDWQQLGFSAERIAKLTSLSIPAVFQEYKNFYIPSF